MRKIWISCLLALLLIVILGLTVYSQTSSDSTSMAAAVQVLQGGVSQKIPIEVTLLIPTESGVQTMTVPLEFDLNLSIGPVNVVDMDVQVKQSSQFVSPITNVSAVDVSGEISSTTATTGTNSTP